QRALAATVGAEDGHDLVFGNVEVEVLVQRPAREVLGEAADGDVRAGGAWLEGRGGYVGKHGGIQDNGHRSSSLRERPGMPRNRLCRAAGIAPLRGSRVARQGCFITFRSSEQSFSRPTGRSRSAHTPAHPPPGWTRTCPSR